MAKIISTLLIYAIGWIVTGYDFFNIAAIITFSIDISEELHKIQKKCQNILKIKLPNGR